MAAAFTYISMNGEEAQNGSVLRNAKSGDMVLIFQLSEFRDHTM